MTAEPRNRPIGAVLGFTFVSRAVGMLREVIIAAAFGFSRATDGFYQLAATPTYLATFLGGPFATAYIAWSNRDDAPGEPLRLILVLRWLGPAVGLLSVAFLAAAVWLQAPAASGRAPLLAPVLMAVACAATGLVGMSAMVANARAHFVRAQAVLFVNNAAFVLLLGINAALLRRQVELALASAFAGGALIAAAHGWRVVRQGADAAPCPRQTAAATRSLRRVFLPMLGMAGIETLGFLASQAVVLGLAAKSGAGITSAGSLAQRIALTANGLVVGPLANVAMVRSMRLAPAAARRYLLRVAGLTLGGLALAAVAITVIAVVVARHTQVHTLLLLTRLIPAYSVWLVAQGANIMLNRLSFARGAAQNYTMVTLAGYACANIARYLVWRHAGFGPAIAVGAAVELAATLVVLGLICRPPTRHE